ncbi:MAG: heparinase [Epulopiscium sp.]|nr:heparinase [Candidatus Epulonipiscium sp.]
MVKKDFFHRRDMHFFLDDIDKITKYVLENQKEEAKKIIKIADDICNQVFLFNLRWDMERTYEPVQFQNKIDWLYMPKDDPEWIYALNRHRYWICLGQAYALTKNEKYTKTFIYQLCDWINNVKLEDNKSQLAWRTIEAGLRCEYWLKAFFYFKDSEYLTDEVCNKFYQSMIQHAEYLMEVYDSFRLMSNWGVLQNHGLFMVGVMLPKSERTKQYIETSLSRLAEEIQIQVYRDGTHWEQSPMYHNEVTHCYLDVLFLAKKNNIHIPAIIWEKTKDMCYVNLYWKKPNHCQVMQGDSDDTDIRDILSKGAYLYKDPILKFGGYKRLNFDCVWDLGYMAIAEYDDLKIQEPKEKSKALDDSGNYYMRSEWTEEANFLHFHCGTLGAGHGHADQLHIDLFVNGEDILVDGGRYTYVNKPERYLFKNSTAHNTIVVDDVSFTICKDSWECSKLSQPVKQQFIIREKYEFVQGGHLGYYDLSTGSIFINRKVIYIKPDIYILVDEFYTGTKHKYNQYFHFNDKGKLLCNDQIEYKSSRNYVEMIFATENVKKEIIDSKISRHYNLIENNKAIKTTIYGKGFQSVITVLSTSSIQNVEKLWVKKVPVRSTFKGITFLDSMIEAITIQKGSRKYTIVVAHQEYASPTDMFEADGCIGFGNVVVFDRGKGENKIGEVLLW